MTAVTRSFVFVVASLATYAQMNTTETSGSVQDVTGGRLRGATITVLRLEPGHSEPREYFERSGRPEVSICAQTGVLT